MFCIIFVGLDYNYLIDGGCAKYASAIEDCMMEYDVMKGDHIKLNGIIVTHPDADHMNGIKTLLEKHNREIFSKCDIVITKAFYWRSRDKQCENFTKPIDRA